MDIQKLEEPVLGGQHACAAQVLFFVGFLITGIVMMVVHAVPLSPSRFPTVSLK